jgi:glycerol-3-phosphate cytidylyltransferase-like family protein
MPGVSDLRKELKELRKASKAHTAVSRMKKEDISTEIQRLKGVREETPAVAAVSSAPPKKMETDVMTIKEAKVKEYPMKPAANDKLRDVSTKVAKGGDKMAAVRAAKKSTKKDEAPKEPKKKLTKAALLKMMEALSDTDE